VNTAAKIVHSPRVTTTASAYCDPSEHLYAPLSLVFSVPRTTREQWVALLTPVVVNLRSVAVHPGPLILVALYDHNISDELDAHSRMSGSSWSPMVFCGALISAPDAATTTSVVNMFTENTCYTEKQYSSKWHAWFDSRCPGRRLSTWPKTGVSCPTALGALCAQLTFRLAWCRQHSAVVATELLQPRDLACGTLFQSSCVILTSPRPTDCSDDIQLKGRLFREAFFAPEVTWIMWLLGRHRKHLLTCNRLSYCRRSTWRSLRVIKFGVVLHFIIIIESQKIAYFSQLTQLDFLHHLAKLETRKLRLSYLNVG